MLTLTRCIFVVALAISDLPALAEEALPWQTAISSGIAYRQQGKLQLSIDLLTQAKQAASAGHDRMLAAGELGVSLLQARRLDQAEVSLQEAKINGTRSMGSDSNGTNLRANSLPFKGRAGVGMGLSPANEPIPILTFPLKGKGR